MSGRALLAFFLLATPAFAQVQPVLICNPDASCVTFNEQGVTPSGYADTSIVPLQGDTSRPNGDTVRVKLTDGKTTWYERIAVPEHAINRNFWLSTGLSLALTIADVENSRLALSRVGTSEANPLFGSHPSRGRYYAVTLPIFAANAYMSYRWKREDAALAYSGIPGHKYAKWHIPNDLNTIAHAIGLAITLGSTGR